MIMTSAPARHPTPARWQHEMASALTSAAELVDMLGLDRGLAAQATQAAEKFRLRVPRGYVARMRYGDANDPLLRQVLPLAAETAPSPPQYVSDPLDERSALRAPGLLQKYQGRALLITTSACAIHCRYCFRREFPYAEQTGEPVRFSEAVETILRDSSIEEVLLSGGDPLSLSDARLTSLTNALSRAPHVKRLRVHTRQPIVLPSRVDEGLLAWLEGLRVPMIFVLHTNHANEIDTSVRVACAKLRGAGVTLLNQTVLLKGVNDDADVLVELSRALFDAGVLPYYLHALDPVSGVAHFDLPEDRALEIAGAVAARLPGYLVPRLVREVAGAPAKVSLPPRFPLK